jgi:hypothetical protein
MEPKQAMHINDPHKRCTKTMAHKQWHTNKGTQTRAHNGTQTRSTYQTGTLLGHGAKIVIQIQFDLQLRRGLFRFDQTIHINAQSFQMFPCSGNNSNNGNHTTDQHHPTAINNNNKKTSSATPATTTTTCTKTPTPPTTHPVADPTRRRPRPPRTNTRRPCHPG